MNSPMSRRTFMRMLGAGIVAGSALDALQLFGSPRVYASVRIKTRAHEEERDVDNDSIFALPFKASHIAVHWKGNHDALAPVEFDVRGGCGAASSALHEQGRQHT